jgi:hypothetical protein
MTSRNNYSVLFFPGKSNEKKPEEYLYYDANKLNKIFVIFRQYLQGNFIVFPVKRGLQQPAV